MDDSTERDAPEAVSEHAQVSELHRAFANGMIAERDYDRALAGIYNDRNRSVDRVA